MPPARKPRWPFEPLMEESRADSMRALSDRLKIDPRQLYRWRDDGLTDVMAERLAMRLGLMPEQVWTDWFDIDLTPLKDEEAAKAEVARAKKRARDKRYRERHRERIAQYRADYRVSPSWQKYLRRYNRSYYLANRDRLLDAQRRARYLRQKEAS